MGNVDGQLRARPAGPAAVLRVNRGSEVFEPTTSGVELSTGGEATAEEDAALDAAAEATVDELGRRGVMAAIVSQRLNRRKIDLIPEPEWADPPKARIAELLAAVEERLRAPDSRACGTRSRSRGAARSGGGARVARVTSDAKHVEIGLTDKADAARWAFAELARRGVGPGLVSDRRRRVRVARRPAGQRLAACSSPEAPRATAISVGAEPSGAPAGVLALGGGPERLPALLADQLERRRRGDVPELDGDPAWTLAVDGLDPRLERVHESLLTLADGRLGTRGAPLFDDPAARRRVSCCSGVYTGDGPATELARAARIGRDSAHSSGRAAAAPRRLDLATGLLREEGAAHLASLLLARSPRHRRAARAGKRRRAAPRRAAPRAAGRSRLRLRDRRRRQRLRAARRLRP